MPHSTTMSTPKPSRRWALAAAIVCSLAAVGALAVDAPRGPSGIDLAGIDQRIKPGNDFDGYANQNWRKTAVIPADLDWSDVGDWSALADILPHDADGNAVVGKCEGLDTHNTLVFGGERTIATIGVQDLLIVDTPDALLICPRHRAQDVKAMVMRLKAQGSRLL